MIPKKLNPFLILFLTVGVSYFSSAQDYSISQKDLRINNVKYDGFSINVNGPFEKVSDQVFNYLKEISKIRRKRNYYSVTELQMDNLKLDSTEVFVRVDVKDNTSTVWLAANTTGVEKERATLINSSLENELVKIARSYYVHEQELKIHEAEAAAQVVSKKQQHLINEKETLTKELSDAEARKIELTSLLEKNKLAIEVYKQKIIDNAANQDSTYIDLQKINRVIDGHKQKLKEID